MDTEQKGDDMKHILAGAGMFLQGLAVIISLVVGGVILAIASLLGKMPNLKH